jgi:hypothetical protein
VGTDRTEPELESRAVGNGVSMTSMTVCTCMETAHLVDTLRVCRQTKRDHYYHRLAPPQRPGYSLLFKLTVVPRLLQDVPLWTFVSVGSALLNGSRDAKGISER